jgi:hypothetical protein
MFVFNRSDKKGVFSPCLRWRTLDFFRDKRELPGGFLLDLSLLCAEEG